MCRLTWLAAFYAVWGNKQIKQYDPCEVGASVRRMCLGLFDHVSPAPYCHSRHLIILQFTCTLRRQILGLDATSCADPKAERSAFRKLSLKWHPDKNPPGALMCDHNTTAPPHCTVCVCIDASIYMISPSFSLHSCFPQISPCSSPSEKRKEAEEMFMKIGKAHEALTDEVSSCGYKLVYFMLPLV